MPRSRGFGIQSPWAYNFLREVIMGTEGKDRHLPFEERLEKRCCRVITVDVSVPAEKLDAFLNEARATDVLLVHDIKRNRVARRLWCQLINDERTGVAFDCFDFGLIFFDLRLYKQKYKVNFAK